MGKALVLAALEKAKLYVPASDEDSSPPPIPPKFRLIPFGKIPLHGHGRDYLVEGLIPRAGLTVVWGPAACGKSFWAMDVGMHVALGWTYRGRTVEPGAVVYCALEGASGFGRRQRAFKKERPAPNIGEIPFHLMAEPLDLIRDHDDLVESIRAQGVHPSLVVIDTLNRSLAGSENDDRDMTAYVRATDAIREAFGCAVMVIHHCGHGGHHPRGHSALTGAADAQVSVKKMKSGNFEVAVEKMKDGSEGERIFNRLKSVDIGRDSDGQPMTSCVVEPADEETGATGGGRSERDEQALGVLREMLDSQGKDAPESLGLAPGTTVIKTRDWRKRLDAEVLHVKNKSDAFKRLVEKLKDREEIEEKGEYVWTPASSSSRRT